MAETNNRGEFIKGGLSENMTLADIAKKHGVSLAEIEAQHKKGIKVEMEHTSNPKIASEISKDHLFENARYYDYLSGMEKTMDKEKDIESKLKQLGFEFNEHNYRYSKRVNEKTLVSAFFDKRKDLYKIRGIQKFDSPLGGSSVGINFDYSNETDFWNKINELVSGANKMANGGITTSNGKSGGLLAGKAHSECDENGCGIKAVVTDGGGSRPVELEAEEAIINKRTMKDPSIYSVTGTPAQIASAINELNGNGVKFASGAKVETVKKVKKFGNGGRFSSTPESLAVLLDDLFKDHCGAFAFAQLIVRTTDSNLASSKELLLAQWNSEIKDHFAEEENELFPLINDGTNHLLIDQLVKEHMYFESVITSIESGESVGSAEIRDFAKKLMLHIQTEDALFMKYGENKYSSPMALVESGVDSGSCVYCVKGTAEQIRSAVQRYESANGVGEMQKAPELTEAHALPETETQPYRDDDTMATGGRLRHNTHDKYNTKFESGGIPKDSILNYSREKRQELILSQLSSNSFFSEKNLGLIELSPLVNEVIDQYLIYDIGNPIKTAYGNNIYFHPDSRNIRNDGLLIAQIEYAAHFITGYIYPNNIRRRTFDRSKYEAVQFLIPMLESADVRRFYQKQDATKGRREMMVYAKEVVIDKIYSITLIAEMNDDNSVRAVTFMPKDKRGYIEKQRASGAWTDALIKPDNETLPSNGGDAMATGGRLRQSTHNKDTNNSDTTKYYVNMHSLENGRIFPVVVDSTGTYYKGKKISIEELYKMYMDKTGQYEAKPEEGDIKFESGGIPSAGDYHAKAKSILESLSAEDLEALKNTYKQAVYAVLLKEQVKLDELSVERERLLSNKKLQEASGNYNSTGAIIAEIGSVDVKARGVNNTILAIRNGGDTVSFTDKKGDLHSGIPDFSKINTTFISFDVDTILTDALPAYIPLIDEKTFANKGYIFDTIRIAKDYYILAVNGFGEVNKSYYVRDAGKPDAKREDWEQGYVMVTLDQLALISDYYYTKAKATERARADESNAEMEKRYAKLPIALREKHFNQAGYYRTLPVAVKKKVTEAEWNGFTLEQKESFYKPIAYKQGKRLVSLLDDKHMWHSFHEMYERFINPEAVQPKPRIANPEVWAYWSAFRYQMDWKIKDIGVQRQFESDIRAAAIETSFGESNTDAELRESLGILVKRQSGDKIKPAEIEQIRKAWVNVGTAFGDLSTVARDNNLKISHTANKLVFASKAAGMYVPSMGTIAVSNKFGDNQFESILAHELAHFIDNKLGGESGHRYYSDDFESTAGLVADALRRNMNVKSTSDYINSTKECFARAMELYFSISTFGDNASVIYSYTELDRKRPYFFEDHYVSKEVYYSVLKPLIEAFLSENKTFLNYNVDVKENAPIKDFSEKPIEINTNLASAKTNDKMDKIKFSEEAINFVPMHQLDSIMGSEQFNDSIEKINDIVAQMPTINDATDSTTDEKIWLHYFSDDLAGNKDNWYINRKDAGDGDDHTQFTAIGYHIDANGEIKYRDINIDELLENDRVELDLYFEPMQWSELYASKYPEEAELESDEKLAEELMSIDGGVWDRVGLTSGGDLYADIELQKKYKDALDVALAGKYNTPLSQGVYDEIEDANYHALNSYLTYSGAFGEEAKDKQAKWYYGLKEESRQYHLNPAVFGIEGEVKEVVPAVKSAEEILGTVAGLEDVIKKYKDSKKEKYLVDEALGSYVRIVYENPLFYTRFTDFVSDTLRSSQYYIQYSDEGNEVVRDADTFHKNIVAGGLNIWNLIPEKFKVSPKVRPVAFKTLPDDKGLIDIHSNFVLNDGDIVRGRLFQTHFDSTGVVSTDAQVLLFTKKRDNYTAGDYCLTKKCFELKEADFEGKQYPNYKAVVPKVDDYMSFIRINHEAVLLYLNTLKKLKLMAPKDKIVLNVNGTIFGFNLNFFKNAIEAMIKMGHNDITMAYSNPVRAVVLFPTVDKDKVEKYKTDFVLVMPVMLSNAEGGQVIVDEMLPVYDLFSNCITNQGSDVCLSNYEAEAKYKALEKKTEELQKKAIIARPTKKKFNRVDIEEEIGALEIALEFSEGKEKKTISKAIAMLKERLEDMGETKECGGYVLEQEGVIIEEIYPSEN